MTPASATGFIAVGDDQIFGRELAVNSVESLERFAVARATNDDLAAFEQVEIERVRGMAHLPQRVVGSVGGVVDGALIDEGKAYAM